MQCCQFLEGQENDREAEFEGKKYGKECVKEQMIYGKRTEAGSNEDKRVDNKDALMVE